MIQSDQQYHYCWRKNTNNNRIRQLMGWVFFIQRIIASATATTTTTSTATVAAFQTAAARRHSEFLTKRSFLDSSPAIVLPAANANRVPLFPAVQSYHYFCRQSRIKMQTSNEDPEASTNQENTANTSTSAIVEGKKKNKEKNEEEEEEGHSSLTPTPKVHHLTVCMVPPPQAADHIWKVVSDMRRQLQDPGYYRWPPHANLLYPFLEIQGMSPKEISDAVLNPLLAATQQVEPFPVQLSQLGTLGGKRRGVLWLAPDDSSSSSSGRQMLDITPVESGADYDSENSSAAMPVLPPLLRLHQHLEEAFPRCKDQTKGGSFTPHMTLSHFETLDDARSAQQEIERDFADKLLTKLEFCMDRIYLLRRQGDGGQFLRVADIGLGKDGVLEYWDPPIPFPFMPTEEEDWVHQERMKLKARRNGSYSSGRGLGRRRVPKRSSSSGRREPRVPDTPEVIAAKRAERKAKKK